LSDVAIKTEWMDLRGLQDYAAVSERTLRTWIHATVDPLPACRVGTKILVRRRDFDTWMEKHRINSVATEAILDEIMAGVGAST
jgi:excisionase family DNA binding protein